MGLLYLATIGKSNVVVPLLQYADDTIFLCDGKLEHLKVIKRILRLFELFSGLKVNYNKSSLYGWNVSEEIMEEWAELLGYVRGSNHLSYLGLKVGINPHFSANWKWLVDKIKNRIACWDGRNISLGGRATLIQSVLSAIPIFALSF